MTKETLLLWVDIETTGLDFNEDYILQIAYVLSDFNLNTLHVFPELTIKQNDEILDNMSDWCKDQHGISGLTYKCKNSKLSLSQAELCILNNINQYTKVQDKLIIAGNSVHFDKYFINHHMPLLAKRLSHQIVDVSSFGLLFKHLNLINEKPIKKYNHTAQSDILESINEYRYYLEYLTN